jgi:hypothetical protein
VLQFEGKKHLVKACIIHYGVHNLKYCQLKTASDICEVAECILVDFTEVSDSQTVDRPRKIYLKHRYTSASTQGNSFSLN